MSVATCSTIEDQLAEFHERGFVVLENVIPHDELERLGDLTNRIVDYASRRLEDPFAEFYQSHRPEHGVLYDVFQKHPEYGMVARSPKVLDFLEKVLGPDIYLYENCLVYKNADSANAVPWHQDFIDRPHEPKKVVVWFALDNVRQANGAMKVIPGSTKNGFLPWCRVEGETHRTRVQPQFVNEEDAIYAELDAGSALVFDQLLLHSSDEVRSGDPRRAVRVSYQGFDRIITPRACPIVMRGGSPESLAARFSRRADEAAIKPPPKNIVRRAINRLGRILTQV